VGGRAWIEACPIVRNGEMEAVLVRPQDDPHMDAVAGVGDGILHRIEAREIDRDGDRLGQGLDRLRLDLDGDWRVRDRGAQARRESMPHEQRRVDPRGELA
jgi:hypothetical protein